MGPLIKVFLSLGLSQIHQGNKYQKPCRGPKCPYQYSDGRHRDMDTAARLCAGPRPRLERPHQQVCDTSTTVCFYAMQENLLSRHKTAKIIKFQLSMSVFHQRIKFQLYWVIFRFC